MVRLLNLLANLFPVWVVVFSVLALMEPRLISWMSKEGITAGLGIIMLGMGMTLTVDDFKRVLKMPKAVAVGFFGQFLIMPFLGYTIARLLNLPTDFAVGLILVSCCPGGTASNVVTFIARANLPLSVLMTMCSTFGAVILTPLLTKLLASQLVPVDAWALLWDTTQVILLPVVVGLGLNHFASRAVKFVMPVAPLVSVVTIALICGYVIGKNADAIKQFGGTLVLAVTLLHSLAFLLGYLFAWLFGYDELIRRTVSIEVGMQNSGLGTVLAKNFANPQTGVALAAVPCAISAVFHSVIGSLLAAIWRTRVPGEAKPVSPDTPHGRQPEGAETF